MIGPPVYIFTAGEAGCFGITLLRNGSNLPPPESHRPWALLLQTTVADDDLLAFTQEIRSARMQLSLNGFYVTRNSATILQFPRAHRSSV